MDGFCELCGRRPSTVERLRQRGIARCEDCGAYLCPDCRHSHYPALAPTAATASQLKGGIAAVGLVAAGAVVGILTLLATLSAYPILFGPAASGGVLSAVETPASSAGGVGSLPSSSAIAVAASTTPPSSSPAALASPAVGSSPAATKPAPGATGRVDSAAGKPVIRTWTGSYGEARVQVILPVRNEGPGWFQLPRSRSRYRILDSRGRDVAGGVFTAAMPEFIGPGETAYLVDTLSATFVDPREFRTAEATVDAIAAAKPDLTLSVGEIELSKGPGGGLRAMGVVRNDGGTTARSVVAGVVVIGPPDGQAIAAVFDLTDVGDLEPGDAVAFDTEYPGAAPVEVNPLEIIGYAFVPS
jgi:hypothetical protein